MPRIKLMPRGCKTSILPLSHISGLLVIRFLFKIQSRLSPHIYLLQFIFWPSICNDFFYGNWMLRGYSQLCAAVGYVCKADVWTSILSFQQCNSFLIFVFHDLDTLYMQNKCSIAELLVLKWQKDSCFCKEKYKWLLNYGSERKLKSANHILCRAPCFSFSFNFTIRLLRGKYNRWLSFLSHHITENLIGMWLEKLPWSVREVDFFPVKLLYFLLYILFIRSGFLWPVHNLEEGNEASSHKGKRIKDFMNVVKQ